MADPLVVPDSVPLAATEILNPGEQLITGDANLDAINRLKVAALRHDNRPDDSNRLIPGVAPVESLRAWAEKSPYHASSILGDDQIHITDAQIAMANDHTKKYRPLEDVGFFESLGSGFNQADLNRLRVNKIGGLSPEDQTKFDELLANADNLSKRNNADGFFNSFASSTGTITNTVVSRALPAGIVGGIAANVGAPIGFAGGFLAGITTDGAVQGMGSALLSMDKIPELDAHENLKNSMAFGVGLLEAALDKVGMGEVVLGKYAKNGIRTIPGIDKLAKGMLGDPATMTKIESFARGVSFSSLAGGTTEGAQEIVDIIGEYAATKLSGERLDPESERELLTISNMKRVFDAAVLGGFADSTFAVPHAFMEAQSAGLNNKQFAAKILEAQASIEKTALSQHAPDVARDMLHAVDLHQTVYLEPDVIKSVTPEVLLGMGIDPSAIVAARDLGQYLEVSTTNLLTARNKEDLQAVLPFVKQQAGLGTNSDVQTHDEFNSSNKEVLSNISDRLTQEKLSFDYAKKTKVAELVTIINNSPELSHELAARFAGDPREYAKGIVNVWAKQAEYISDSDMTRAHWMNALTIKNIGRIAERATSMGVYGNNKIGLSKASNGTTLIHEGSHHFLQMWMDAHASQSLTEGAKADLETLAKWAGTSIKEVSTNKDSYRKLHEAVAVATEEILTKGSFLDSMTTGVRKMFDRLVGMFQKYYTGAKVAAQEGRMEMTPQVEAIMDSWMFGANRADMAAAHANLLPDQVEATLNKLGLNAAQVAIAKTSLGRALETARTRMIRENTRLFKEKRNDFKAEARQNANESPGRVALIIGENKLSAFEVRTLYGEDTLQEFTKRGLIAPESNTLTVQELIANSGFSLEEFSDQLLTPGGEYAVDMMENIRFIKESGNLRPEWVAANFTPEQARIILTVAKVTSTKEDSVAKHPYKYDTSLYAENSSGDVATYARTILVEQYKNRFKALHEKMVAILEQKQLNTIVANTTADVSTYKKLRDSIDRKLTTVKALSTQASNRSELFDIGAKKKIFSNKDISYLENLAKHSELADVKDQLLDEALALKNAISGIGSSVVARTDIPQALDHFLETDKQLRNIYKTGDWWDQQWLSRWLSGQADSKTEQAQAHPEVGFISRMPDAWRGYFNLLDSIKAGETEGLHHAWLRDQVSPQVRNQITEITAPPEATGLTEFGLVRPPGDFDSLSGPTQKVEAAFTSEERNAESRKLIFAMALIPSNVRETMYEIHKAGGVTQMAADTLPDGIYSILDGLGMIKENGIKAAGQVKVDTTTSLNELHTKTTNALEKMESPFSIASDVDGMILQILDTPKTIQEQIETEVRGRLNELLLQPNDEMLINDNKYWSHLKDMSLALAHIFGNEKAGASKIPPTEFVNQARDELANMPVKNATDAKKAFADFVRSQAIVKKAIYKGQFRQALIAHNTGMRNYQRTIQAADLKQAVAKAIKLAKTMAKVKPGDINAEYHGAYLMLAEKIGLITRAPKWARGYEVGKVLEKYDHAEANRIIQLARPESLNYQEMTSGNFVTINESLQMLHRLSIINSGVKQIQLTAINKKISAKEMSDKGIEELKDYTPKETVVGSVVKKSFAWLDPEVTTLGYLFEALNRFRNVTGKGVRGIFTDIYNEFATGARRKEEASVVIKDIHKALVSFRAIANTMPKINADLPSGNKFKDFKWTPERVFNYCALHGNTYQAQALRDGYGLTEAESQRILDALPDEAWQHVNTCVKTVGVHKKELFDVHERVAGYRPASESATPFMAGGKLRSGGWVPLYYDRSLTKEVTQTVDEMQIESTMAIFPPSASTGREKARRGSGGKPPELSTDIFGRGLLDQITYMSFAQPISTYNAVMSANKGALRSEVKRVLGEENYKLLEQNISTFDPKQSQKFKAQEKISKLIVRYFKPLSTVSALALNLRSAIRIHTAQHFISINAVGFNHYLSGVMDTISNPEMRKFARDNSPHLKETLGAIEAQAIHLSTKFNSYGTSKRALKAVTPIVMMQHMIADYPLRYSTWIGAYKMLEHLPENERILEADKIVSQTMPVGNMLEKTRISWNENSALTLASAFLTNAAAANSRLKGHYNAWVNGETDGSTFAQFIVTERLLSPLVFYATIPLLGYAMTGDDDYLKTLAVKNAAIDLAGYQLSGLPVVREIANFAANQMLDKPASFRPNTLAFAESIGRTVWSAGFGWKDDPQQSAINASLLFGVGLGIPLTTFHDRLKNNLKRNGDDILEALITGSP